MSLDKRLEHLFEVSKLFTSFESVEHTFDSVLRVMTRSLPLSSAILLEVEGESSKMSLWPSGSENSEQMQAAKEHIEAACAYLGGTAQSGALKARSQEGMPALPEKTQVAPRSGNDRRFIVMPLVIARRPILGALQVEAAGPVEEADLTFVNAIANQLAIALDRDRARRRDIERREQAEALSHKYEALVDHLDHAFVWEADVGTLRVSYVSARAEQLLGVPRRQLLEEPSGWMTIVHPEDRDSVRTAFDQASSEDAAQRCEHRCVALGGRVRWFQTRVQCRRVNDAAILQGVSFDITPSKEAERLIHEAYEQAQQAVRTREQVLSIVSHDLRNPLSAILMATRALAPKEGMEERRQGLAVTVGRVQRATERMQRLIADLLDFGSIEAGRLAIKLGRERPESILNEALASIEPLARQKHLQVKVEVDSSVPPIECDRDRLLQVINNLTANAVQVLDQGGVIELKVRQQDHEITFAVSDNGPGISERDRAHLFDRYFRGDARYRGNGLGLAIAHGIVTAHGGRIWVESELGRGATFYFTVPVAGESESSAL